MQVLLLGTMVPDSVKEFCFAKGIRTSAADSVQHYMAHGLEAMDKVESVDVIGAVRLKTWPRTSILHLDSAVQKASKGTITGVGYLNLPMGSFLLREHALVSEAKKWAKKHRDASDVVVLVYSMHSPFMKAAKAVKKRIPTARVVLTVADLPLYMDMRGTVRKLLKKMDWRRIQALMPFVDKYLLYTKYMADYLQLPEGRWMVFEGLIDDSRVVTGPQEKYPEKICLYAGNLDARYGIDTLIDAFRKCRSEAKLYIYGAGFDSGRIAALVEPLNNVEYKGQVTPDEILEIMKKATLLINPRPSAIGLAKYSCPSKTFEYMASGTPALMNKLPGLPEEYAPYVLFFDEETAEGYAAKIDEVLSRPQEALQQFGLHAAAFLRKEKNSLAVMKKVVEFIGK